MFFLIVFTGAQSILSSPFMPSSALREQEAWKLHSQILLVAGSYPIYQKEAYGIAWTQKEDIVLLLAPVRAVVNNYGDGGWLWPLVFLQIWEWQEQECGWQMTSGIDGNLSSKCMWLDSEECPCTSTHPKCCN
jgi:hypothetical protein